MIHVIFAQMMQKMAKSRKSTAKEKHLQQQQLIKERTSALWELEMSKSISVPLYSFHIYDLSQGIKDLLHFFCCYSFFQCCWAVTIPRSFPVRLKAEFSCVYLNTPVPKRGGLFVGVYGWTFYFVFWFYLLSGRGVGWRFFFCYLPSDCMLFYCKVFYCIYYDTLGSAKYQK